MGNSESDLCDGEEVTKWVFPDIILGLLAMTIVEKPTQSEEDEIKYDL
jgi:hypothetical protein